jgi:putative transposase
MKDAKKLYHGYRFPPTIISHAVWLYHRFCLSLRDVEDLLAERGIVVSYESIRQWCNRFGPEYAQKLKKRQAYGANIRTSRMILLSDDIADDLFVQLPMSYNPSTSS